MACQVEAERRRRLKAAGIYGHVPRLARSYKAPRHLDPLVQALERAWFEPLRVAAHAPPRHGKTETVLAYVALTLELFPWKTLAYVTYEADLAYSKSRKARAWAIERGVELASDAQRMGEWRTTAGGGLLAGGVGGPLTGQGVDLLIVDDPYKNRAQAESAAYQRMVADWWGDVAETRIEPGGSAFVFHTRWVTADLIGKVLAGEDAARWLWLCMPALAEEGDPSRQPGEALWPERWTAEALAQKAKAVGPYTWASLYQGRPQPRGGAVFGAPHFFDALPAGYRVAIGVDLAYTEKTKADHSVALVVAEKDGVFYLLEVHRARLKAPAFTERLKHLKGKYPGAPFRWIASGTEVGSADFIKEAGIPLVVDNASSDKFVRSIDLAADWNDGRVLLPSAPTPWVPDLLDEFSVFTGVNDLADDQVDALAAAHRVLSVAAVRLPRQPHVPRRI